MGPEVAWSLKSCTVSVPDATVPLHGHVVGRERGRVEIDAAVVSAGTRRVRADF